MKYLVIVEKSKTGFSAYVPDLPGCVASAPTTDQVLKDIQIGIGLHLELLHELGEPDPEPTALAAYQVEAAA